MESQEQKILSVLMVGRIFEEEAVFILIQQAIGLIAKRIETVFYFTDSRTKNKIVAKYPTLSSQEFIPSQHHCLINYIICIGGDGTILYAAKQFKSQIPPIITFQRGSLGFMCRFSLVQMEDILDKTVRYYKKQIPMPFDQSKLMRLNVLKINQREQLQARSLKVCINEVYISRKGHQRVTLEIKVNGEVLTTTSGDGILISTPTGSTAYSLSAGGPILESGVNGILIVPISPNSLSFRPICLPSNSTITVRLHQSSRSQAYASFDGQSIQDFGFAHELSIQRSQFDITFFESRKQEAKLPSWIQRLKYFLGWNEKYNAPIHQYSPQKVSSIHNCENID